MNLQIGWLKIPKRRSQIILLLVIIISLITSTIPLNETNYEHEKPIVSIEKNNDVDEESEINDSDESEVTNSEESNDCEYFDEPEDIEDLKEIAFKKQYPNMSYEDYNNNTLDQSNGGRSRADTHYYSKQSGDFFSSSTWYPSGVPGSSDDITILPGHSVWRSVGGGSEAGQNRRASLRRGSSRRVPGHPRPWRGGPLLRRDWAPA